ncbi:MAG TPA: hypothetical protein DD490_06590 [Acidobacteria bacterium]|nr:hypothetical protein [Acidobacteriota bacterium]
MDAFVTGVANPKVVQVYYGGGVRKWFMAFNTLIQADSGPGSRWRILWAYSDDGKIWTVDPQVLFRSSSEAMSGCGGKGLMVTNLFIDNGNFYMAFTEIGKPYAYLVRSPINTVNRVPGYSTWNIASSPIQANGEWTWKPLTPGIQQDFTSPPLNAASILPSCESSPPFMVKQSYIGRFFQSSTPNSPSRYIAVTSDMVGGQTKLQVWSSASLNKPFQYESDVAISAQDIGQFGLEFAFTQYPDNLPSSPRLLAPQLDFWLVRNIGAGLSQVTVSRRTAKLTGGGIF